MQPTVSVRKCYACEAVGVETLLEDDALFCSACGSKLDAILERGSTLREFELRGLLGEGGMGQVYFAVDPTSGKKVAIKRIQRELSDNPQIRGRFLEEARTMSALNHPNIARLNQFFAEGDRLFLVMDFIEGTTVDSLLESRGPLQPRAAVKITATIARALHYMHTLKTTQEFQDEHGTWVSREINGVVHRDVKASNILLEKSGRPFLIDFGIAKTEGGKAMTEPGKILGTYEYMSPDQIRGDKVGQASDQYSLAITLYEMLTGRVPFPQSSRGETDGAFAVMDGHVNKAPPPPSQFRPGLPGAVQTVIMRALAKRPEERFPSCETFAKALEEALQVPAGRLPTDVGTAPESFEPSQRALTTPPPDDWNDAPSRPDRTWLYIAVAAVVVAVIAVLAATAGKDGGADGDKRTITGGSERLTRPPDPCLHKECGGKCGSCGPGAECSDGKCVTVCRADCAGRECGDDGCEGSCGKCSSAAPKCENGRCETVCRPDCDGNECGDDGCGGSCGKCPSAAPKCKDGECVTVCMPKCAGKECGDDGCEGSCGRCPSAAPKCENGRCVTVCKPDCYGKDCGTDGCGGSCGQCGASHVCSDGKCQCIPDCYGKECGDDGCGGSCGECTGSANCSNGRCVGARTPIPAGMTRVDGGCFTIGPANDGTTRRICVSSFGMDTRMQRSVESPTWVQANQSCERRGLKLISEAQWEFGVRNDYITRPSTNGRTGEWVRDWYHPDSYAGWSSGAWDPGAFSESDCREFPTPRSERAFNSGETSFRCCRVVRGAVWRSNPWLTYRSFWFPDGDQDNGWRCVLEL